MGLDPGYRSGVKTAIVDATGKVLDTATIYPHKPQSDWRGALSALGKLIVKHGVTLITIGIGTASRETEQLAAELTREMDGVFYLIVNEAGASVYSASPLARATAATSSRLRTPHCGSLPRSHESNASLLGAVSTPAWR